MVLVERNDRHLLHEIFNLEFPCDVINAYFYGCNGDAWIDNKDNPSCCQILVGDYCFFCGSSMSPSALDLVRNIPKGYKSSVLVTINENQSWDKLIHDTYKHRVISSNRYSTKIDPRTVNLHLLNYYSKKLPPLYYLSRIDGLLYHKTKEQKWSSDLCAQFSSDKDFLERGFGYVVLKDGEIVSGASSYIAYPGHIEIEVHTKPGYRNRGLALSCSAKLVNECIKRSIYPNWDAANKESLRLACKLGYNPDIKYGVNIILI